MRAITAVLLLLALAMPALAQEEPAEPDTPEQAAEKVLAAFKARDEAALKALAEKDAPDPWLVADALISRGEHDSALAFAKAASREDTEKLPDYVGSRRTRPPDAPAREVLKEAERAFRAGDPEAALAALDIVPSAGEDVTSVLVLHSRGMLLRSLSRLGESTEAFLNAAENAKASGVARPGGRGAARGGGLSAYSHHDYGKALECWKRRVSIDEARSNLGGVAAGLGNIGLCHLALGDNPKALA